jgi:hypothetical protein
MYYPIAISSVLLDHVFDNAAAFKCFASSDPITAFTISIAAENIRLFAIVCGLPVFLILEDTQRLQAWTS